MENVNIGILFILGAGVFGGLMGAWLFQRMRIPQVVGYIAIGLILGQSGFQVIKQSDIAALQPFNLFALGIIGFLVGGELKLEILKKYARQFVAILLGEGLGAFILVGVPVMLIVYMVIGNFAVALAAGIVTGAIASATDPASTIDVLWEYRARGILTLSITAIVALDDALAMSLYGLGTSTAEILTTSSGSILHGMSRIAVELFGAVGIGIACAFIFRFLLRWFHQKERSLALSLGLILLLIWISSSYSMDVILATMTAGCMLINIAPRRSAELFELMRGFSVPIYVMFFVLVGARLGVSEMPGWLWFIVLVYVLGRSIGKISGAWLGARCTGSESVVRRYLGLGLFAQGGVAVGLSIMASEHLSGVMFSEHLSLGDAIIFSITTTTLIVQVLGPPLVKLAIKLAGEAGRNVTDEDVIGTLKVADVMRDDVQTIPENLRLAEVISNFTEHDYLICPVVNRSGKLIGTVSLNEMKSVLADRQSWEWLLASDVMQHVAPEEKAYDDSPLKEVLDYMHELNIDQLPVIDRHKDNRPVGMLDMVHIRKRIGEELIRRQQPQYA